VRGPATVSETTRRRPRLVPRLDRVHGDLLAMEGCEAQDDEAEPTKRQRDADDDPEQSEPQKLRLSIRVELLRYALWSGLLADESA
jgi:hypothetical protein